MTTPGQAWLGLAGLLALGSVLSWWMPAATIDWQPQSAHIQPWRAWTAAWVHWSPLHLAANLGGCALVAALGWAARLPMRAALAWFVAWPLTQLGLLLQPELARYGGLSGVLHAGAVVAALFVLFAPEEPGRRRAVGGAVLAGIAVKLLLEQPWGPALRHVDGWDIALAPLAHASGAAAGLLCAAVAIALGRVAAERHRVRTPPRGSVTDSARKEHLDALAVLLLVGCCGVWGLGQVAAKLALGDIPPLLQASLRSLGAATLLLGWSRWRGLALWQRDGTGPAGVLAGSLFALEFGCIFIGLQFTSASRMAVFLYLAPFVVALGMPLIARHERLSLRQAGGLVLAFAGVVWAFADGFARPVAGAGRQWLGDLLGIAAAALWGLTTLTLRGSSLNTAPPEKTLLYQLAVSSVALAAGSLVAREAWPQQVSPLALASLLFQTVVITFASYLVWFWLIRHYPATRVSAFTLLTPVFGLLAGVLLLGEPLTAQLVVALAAVCCGIWLVSTRRT